MGAAGFAAANGSAPSEDLRAGALGFAISRYCSKPGKLGQPDPVGAAPRRDTLAPAIRRLPSAV
jgi:hypothetical protein